MTPLVWLALAVVAALGAGAIGVPVWRQVRSREVTDRNVDRYRAWRGQSRPVTLRATDGGPTPAERRRLVVAALLAALAVSGLVAFFLTT